MKPYASGQRKKMPIKKLMIIIGNMKDIDIDDACAKLKNWEGTCATIERIK